MGDKDDDLELFRNQWKRELNDKTSKKVDDSKQTGITADDNVNDEEDDVHKKVLIHEYYYCLCSVICVLISFFT